MSWPAHTDLRAQPYWAAPMCFLWNTFNQTAYLVPVPVESGHYRRIVPTELNIDSWVLMGTELEGEELLPVETFRTITIGSDVLRGASFLLHYLPQVPGDYARNRGGAHAAKGSLPTLLGNVLVVKLDEEGGAVDLPGDDMSLVQHLVLG